MLTVDKQDIDFYKLKMGNAVNRLHPEVEVEYKFIDRDNTLGGKKFVDYLIKEINDSFKMPGRLKNQNLGSLYNTFYANHSLNWGLVNIWNDDNDKLQISIKGYWWEAIYFETILMSMISECWHRFNFHTVDYEDVIKNIEEIEQAHKDGLKIVDMGTRRRFSKNVHNMLLQDCCHLLHGTSNVELARFCDIPVFGTHAHEWFMYYGTREETYKYATCQAIFDWRNIYPEDQTILTDTFTTDLFINTTVDYIDIKSFRHDSGCPFEFTDKILSRFHKVKNPTIVYSDGLNIDKARKIYNNFKDRVNCIFGIGTYLTNNVGHKPLNIVIKPVKFKSPGQKWKECIKVSDTPEKAVGPISEVERAKNEAFN